jgi:hypothetical protein
MIRKVFGWQARIGMDGKEITPREIFSVRSVASCKTPRIGLVSAFRDRIPHPRHPCNPRLNSGSGFPIAKAF